jgi:hypothetical protein
MCPAIHSLETLVSASEGRQSARCAVAESHDGGGGVVLSQSRRRGFQRTFPLFFGMLAVVERELLCGLFCVFSASCRSSQSVVFG